MEELLLATGGSPTRLKPLATSLDQPAEQVLRAARFFVQEMLLHPDADAYRVLGVRDDVDQATVKRHYRALQQWLHPDRLSNSPESVYSARVNHAWDLLRTTTRREAYDVSLARSSGGGSGAPVPPKVHVQRWERVEQPAGPAPRPQLLLTFLLFVLCIGLLWLAIRDRPAPTLPEFSGPATSAPDAAEEPATASISASGPAPMHVVPSRAARVPAVGALPELPTLAPAQVERGRVAGLDPVSQSSRGADLVPPKVPMVAPRSGTRDTAHTVAVAAAVAAAAPAPTTKPVTAPTDARTAPSDPARSDAAAQALLERQQAAQQQARRLLGYLTRPNAQAPPIWRNVPALESAEAIRDRLADGASLRRARADNGQTRWIMGEDAAALVVPVQPADRSSSPLFVRASLVWHDDVWWVESVSLERSE